MSVLVRRYLDRSRLAAELVENWQIEHQGEMLTWAVEDLVSECVELGKLARQVWDRLVNALFDEHIENIDAAGAMMRAALHKTLDASDKVSGLVRQLANTGRTIAGTADLELTRRDMRTLQEDFERTWPMADDEVTKMMEDARAAFARGEYQTTEELLNAAQMHRPPFD